MAIIKCKMCGGDLELMEGSTVAECEYCGTRQTVPTADNEKKLTLFSRANRLRFGCEFDKAAGVYESIVSEFPEEAEAYWGLVLCRYGIEYVDDPATGKKIPTCHRSSFDSIMEDADFEQACENADAIARRVYRDEAKQLEEIRKGIIEVSGKEEPYDIFICYKETAESGDRTVDSVLAQDVYDALTEKGYRVFFSRITLEDKLGTEYEPYIFAALNSAKLMLAFGTDYEYYNAVWVKNEWSRFLKLMAADKTKYLIPCYKGIDAYDMPKEFAKLQAQDMGKVGAMQDLLRGIEKILPKNKADQAVQTVQTVQQTVVQSGPNTESLLKRAFLFLEDGEWKSADEYCDRVLDIDPECAEAYLGKLMAELRVGKREHLINCIQSFDRSKNYSKVLRFGDAALVRDVKAANESIIARNKAEEKAAEKQRRAEEKAAEERRRAEEKAAEERRRAEEERRRAAEKAAEEARKAALKNLPLIRKKIAPAQRLISAGCNHTVGLKSDGTVIAIGSNDHGLCDVSGWKDIVAVAAGPFRTVGLKADGTVVAVGDDFNGRRDVSGWKDTVAVSAGFNHTVGLKADGTVVAVGDNSNGQCDVSGWRDIVAVSAGFNHTVGLKADGTVVAVGHNKFGQCDVRGWQDIVAVSAGLDHTVGLKADGTVVAVGSNPFGQCDVSGWRDIVAVSAGDDHTVGLKSDGTVVAVGNNSNGQCDVSGWKDIVAVSAGSYHTVGLKSDGTVVAVGKNDHGQCNVNSWHLFNSIDTLKEERTAAKDEALKKEREAKAKKLNAEKSSLSTELSNLHGLFTGKRRKEIETRIAEIDVELKKL